MKKINFAVFEIFTDFRNFGTPSRFLNGQRWDLAIAPVYSARGALQNAPNIPAVALPVSELRRPKAKLGQKWCALNLRNYWSDLNDLGLKMFLGVFYRPVLNADNTD